MTVTNRWPGFLVIFLAAAIWAGFVVVRTEQAAAPAPDEHTPLPSGQALTAAGVSALRSIVDGANNPELRWPNFAPYRTEFRKVYEKDVLVWIQNGRMRS